MQDPWADRIKSPIHVCVCVCVCVLVFTTLSCQLCLYTLTISCRPTLSGRPDFELASYSSSPGFFSQNDLISWKSSAHRKMSLFNAFTRSTTHTVCVRRLKPRPDICIIVLVQRYRMLCNLKQALCVSFRSQSVSCAGVKMASQPQPGAATEKSQGGLGTIFRAPSPNFSWRPPFEVLAPPPTLPHLKKNKLSRKGIKEQFKKWGTHTLTHKQKLELSVFHNTNLVYHNIIKTTAILCWLQSQPWSFFLQIYIILVLALNLAMISFLFQKQAILCWLYIQP